MTLKFVYFVTWCLTTVVSIPCPDQPKPDEFGRFPSMGISCSVNHTKVDKDCDYQTQQMSRDSAIAFIQRAKKSDNEKFNSSVVDIKLDSIKIILVE